MAKIFPVLLLGFCCQYWVACSNNPEKTAVQNDSVLVTPAQVTDTLLTEHAAEPVEAQYIDTNFNEFAFVAANQYLILSAFPTREWAKGAPKLCNAPVVLGGGAYAAVTNVNADNIPAAYKKLLNKKIIVCSEEGNCFPAKITVLKLYSTFIPHFGQAQKWNGTFESGDSAYTDQQIAEDVWNSTEPCLVAEFSVDTAEKKMGKLCFAVPGNNPTPQLFALATTDAAGIKSKIRTLLSETEDYKALQKEYSANPENTGNWWESAPQDETFSYFEVKKGESYAIMGHVAGNACGEGFYASETSVWKLDAQFAPSFVFTADLEYTITLAMDLNNDGELEFLADNGFGKLFLIKRTVGKWIKHYGWTVPYQDCPC